MRTKDEIRKFLDSQVGKKVNSKTGRFNGQCVSLIKALFEFMDIPSPYKARGNAKDAGDTYLREGIAKKGIGWLTIAVRRTGGGGYGHIWIDLKNEANYEQNGAKRLLTTKNTRPLSQAQQLINLDHLVKKSVSKPKKKTNEQVAKEVIDGKWGNGSVRKQRLVAAGYDYNKVQAIVNKLVSGKGSATYTVQPGDYLLKVGRKTRRDWRDIARANNLRSPYTIYPGQVLKLP